MWAPCAGPILGGITSTIAREGIGTEAFIATAGYGLGMVLPLTAVSLGGRRLMGRLRKVADNGRRVNLAMGVILLLTSALFFSGLDTKVNRFIATHLPLTSTPVASLSARALTTTPRCAPRAAASRPSAWPPTARR